MSIQNRLDRIVALSAVAATGATVGFVQNAEAAIVSSGPVNINIPVTTAGIYLNVVTGATGTSSSLPGWDVNPWGSSNLAYFSSAGGPTYVQRTGGGATANLAAGTLIGGASVYGASNAANTGSEAHVFNGVNIIGFRFQNEANGNAIHYGWMKISLGASFTDAARAIVEYAYEDQAGVGIQAGAVPTPGTAALLALGAVGMAGRRRK